MCDSWVKLRRLQSAANPRACRPCVRGLGVRACGRAVVALTMEDELCGLDTERHWVRTKCPPRPERPMTQVRAGHAQPW